MIVNGLNISDNVNYLVEEVSFRSIPKRTVNAAPLSRAPGNKLTGVEWDSKEISVKGRVFGADATTMRSLVDTLQQNFAVQSLALSVDADRTYTATLTKLDIPTQFFNNTMVEYDATFLAVDPFAYGSLLTASGTTISGTVTYSGTVTISGTVFGQPLLTFNPTGARAGNSGIKAMKITHVPTGETLTISGLINYTSDIVIDYANFLVTNSGVQTDYTGIFSRFGPGAVAYTITVTSGTLNGYNWKWSYQPRYYQ